jgi:hypothetical protein
MTDRLLALIGAWLSVAAGCSMGSKSCNEAGCLDQATISIHTADWNTPPFKVELDVDGRPVSCPVLAPEKLSGTCGDAIRIERREQSDCREVRTAAAVSEACTRNGRFALVATLPGTPARIGVTVKSGETVVGQRTFEMSYTEWRPNGPDCDPLCRQSSQTWELP